MGRDKVEKRIGEVYWVKLEGKNHVQNGWHPAIITQNNVGNKFSDTIVVVPVTSKRKTALPTHVALPYNRIGLQRPSTAQCEGQRPVSKEDFGDYIGQVDDETMKAIAIACLVNTPYQLFMSETELMSLKRNGKIS